MVSEFYIIGMLQEAKRILKNTPWYYFVKRSYINGYIKACESTLKI